MKLFNTLNNKYESYFVGGAVRDMILGYNIKDYDITTSADPKEIIKTLSNYKTIDIGGPLGTVLVKTKNYSCDITPFRIEGDYIKNRKPSEIIFSKDIKEDVKRRDFTINALLYNGEIIDLVGGLKDLENKKIRSIGDPNKRISEDALRILRAIRFSTKYKFSLDEDLKIAIRNNRNLLKNISWDRIRDEFSKILLSDNSSYGLMMMADLGIFEVILPEIIKTIGYDQRTKYHGYTLFHHLLNVVENSPYDISIRLAALFHDIDKPDVFSIDEDGNGHFYGHEIKSSKTAVEILKRFGYKKDIIKKVEILILNHMKVHDVMTDKALRRQIRCVGRDNILDLYDLMISDRLSTTKDRNADDIILRKNRVMELLNEDISKDKFLAVDGKDLIKLGFIPGPKFKIILNELEQMALDDPSLNTREKLIEIIERSYNE